MDDRFDSPALSDFPTDVPPNYDWIMWLLITACLVVFGCILSFRYMRASSRSQKSVAIDTRARAVMEVLSPGAKAAKGNLVEAAGACNDAVKAQFKDTLALSVALNKVMSGLNGAIEGTKKEAYAPKSPLVPGQMTGGTIINIAIGADGKPLADTPAPALDMPAARIRMSPEEQQSAIWLAVQKLFDYWKNLSVVTEAYKAAQRQLCEADRWVPPEEPRVQAAKPKKS